MAITEEEIVTRLSVVGRAAYSAELARASASVTEMSTATQVVGTRLESTTRGLGFFRRGMQGVHDFAVKTAKAIGLVTIALGYFGTKLIESASNAYETQQKFDKVFQGMGSGPQDFIDRTFAKFGYAKMELEDAQAMFAIFGKSARVPLKDIAEFSETLVQAGIDMASFYNKDPSVVFNAISSGLAGNIRPLRAYGIFLSQSVVKAKGAQMGLTGTLTDAQKVLIRQKLILEQLGDSHNDLARTSGSLQNQWRGLKGRATQLGITFGQMLLPGAIALVHGLNNMLGPAITRISTLVGHLGDFSTVTAVHFGWLENAANHFADAVEAFVNGGPAGLLEWMDNMLHTGTFLQTFFAATGSIIHSVGIIITEAAVPAWKTWAPAATLLNIPLMMLAGILGFLADHIGLTTFLIRVAIGVWLFWKAVTLAQFIAISAVRLVMLASRVPWLVMTAASWGHASALTAETAATWAFGTASWSALLPWIALIALFVLVAVATYMLLDHFGDLTDGAVSGFGDILGAAESVAGFVGGMWEGMVDGVRGAMNTVIGYIERAINFGIELLNQLITSVNHIPGVYIDHIDYVELPRLHQGGRVVAPGTVNIRPDEELISLPSGATVEPLRPGWRDERRPPPADQRPRIVQLVVDRKVLAEVMVDGNEDIEARR